MRQTILLLLAATLLAGCTGGPQATPPTEPTTPATETHRLKNRADVCPKPTRIDHGRHDEPWRRKNHIGKARR